MSAALAADLLVVLHLAFVVFVAAGGFLALRWPKVAWVHIPAAAWGALVEIAGWICPLTPLENRLRQSAGGDGYAGDFVARYLLPVLYPEGLTRKTQLAIGATVILMNIVVYAAVILSARRARPGAGV